MVATMSFRRRRDEWDDFLERHGAELRACGVPDYLVADKKRFLVFLDHGYDEVGWYQDHGAFFNADVLTDDQITRLAELVSKVDGRYAVSVSSRWKSSGHP